MATVELTHEQRKTFITVFQTSASKEEVVQRLLASESFPDTYQVYTGHGYTDTPLSVPWVTARERMIERRAGLNLKWLPVQRNPTAEERRLAEERREKEAAELKDLIRALR